VISHELGSLSRGDRKLGRVKVAPMKPSSSPMMTANGAQIGISTWRRVSERPRILKRTR
jgi:hypothetical protein